MKMSRIIIVALGGITVQPITVYGSALITELLGRASESVVNKVPLSKENEVKIREIADEMGITEKFTVHGGLGMGAPVCGGNRLYFSDSFFNTYKDKPDAIRFCVGHELGHLAKRHGAKILLYVVIPGMLVGCLAAKYLAKTSVGEKFNALLADRLYFAPKFMRDLLGVATTELLMYPIIRTGIYSQTHANEFDADSFSLEKPSATMSKEDLAVGAAQIFFDAHQPTIHIRWLKWLEKHLLLHPSTRERLRRISFPERVSREAGEKLLRLLREKFVLYHCSRQKEYIVSLHKEGIGGEFNENSTAIHKNFWLCSIYPSIAKEYISRLKELKDQLTRLDQALKRAEQLSMLDAPCFDQFEEHDRDRLKKALYNETGKKRSIDGRSPEVSAFIADTIDQEIKYSMLWDVETGSFIE